MTNQIPASLLPQVEACVVDIVQKVRAELANQSIRNTGSVNINLSNHQILIRQLATGLLKEQHNLVLAFHSGGQRGSDYWSVAGNMLEFASQAQVKQFVVDQKEVKRLVDEYVSTIRARLLEGGTNASIVFNCDKVDATIEEAVRQMKLQYGIIMKYETHQWDGNFFTVSGKLMNVFN